MTIKGTSGNDSLSGTGGNDIFNMAQGGTDSVEGGAGNDSFHFGATFDMTDTISGGIGNDILVLTGDYSGAHQLSFTSNSLTSVEAIQVSAGHSYNLTTTELNVSAGVTMKVDASALGAADVFTFNGEAETNGNFTITGGAGNDTIRDGGISSNVHAGDGNDTIYGMASGHQTVFGEGGNDFFSMQSASSATFSGGDGNDTVGTGSFLVNTDNLDGGAGSDEIDMGAGYAGGFVFKAHTISNVETLFLDLNQSFKLTMADGNVAAGQHMDIDGDLLQNGNTAYIDASRETDATLFIGGGTGNDTLIGGQAGTTFSGGGGHDVMTAGAGADTFLYYGEPSDSSGPTYDTIKGFDGMHDNFNLIPTVTGFDAAITAGTLNTSHFDDNLATAVDAAHLAAGHATMFTATHGNLAGHTFLVVDANGVAGYQSGGDFVMELTGGTNLASVGVGSFI